MTNAEEKVNAADPARVGAEGASPSRTPPKTLMIMLAVVGVIVLIGLPVTLRRFVIEAFKIPAGSMIPTLVVGDHIFVKKYAYAPGRPPVRGDVIVFQYPVNPKLDFVKRVVAVGGDTIQVCGDGVVLNGQRLPWQPVSGTCAYEDFDEETGHSRQIPCVKYTEVNGDRSYDIVLGASERGTSCSAVFSVPPGAVFVLGDNRDNSHDSRYWGSVPESMVKGRAWLIWLPGGSDSSRLFQRL